MTREEMNDDIASTLGEGEVAELLHDQKNAQNERTLVILKDVEGLEFLYNFLSEAITVSGTSIPPVTKIPKGGGV